MWVNRSTNHFMSGRQATLTSFNNWHQLRWRQRKAATTQLQWRWLQGAWACQVVRSAAGRKSNSKPHKAPLKLLLNARLKDCCNDSVVSSLNSDPIHTCTRFGKLSNPHAQPQAIYRLSFARSMHSLYIPSLFHLSCEYILWKLKKAAKPHKQHVHLQKPRLLN